MTTGTHNFVSFILSVAPVGALIAGLAGLSPCAATAACVVKHNFQTMLRIISQLIKCMSKVLQKLLKCFNGTTVSTFLFFSY